METEARPACLFCGGDASEPDHLLRCSGRQGRVEAEAARAWPPFGGETYVAARDGERLYAQLTRVWRLMSDHAWHTLGELSAATGDPEASVSARLRDLRKRKFGGFQIERQYVANGLWEYRLL